VLIAQISDLHLRADGLHFGIVDNSERVRQAFAFLHRLSTRPAVLLATGDLTEQGEPASYAELHAIAAGAEFPVFVLPGNHDDRRALAAEFASDGYLPASSGPLHYVVDRFPVRIVAFDSTVPLMQNGDADDAGLGWLDDVLSADDRVTVVATHHPPFRTGIWWMDQMGMRHADRFREVIERHPHVRLVLAGHVHRPIQTAWGPTLVSVCPSTTLAVAYDVTPETPPRVRNDPPMVGLHTVDAAGVVTHHVPFLAPDHEFGFGTGDTWDRARALLAAGGPIPYDALG
jgi:3',5'-cyclic AMP phosphodiesterase CpdA